MVFQISEGVYISLYLCLSVGLSLIYGIFIHSIYKSINSPVNSLYKKKVWGEFIEIWKLLKEKSYKRTNLEESFYRVAPVIAILIAVLIALLIPIPGIFTFYYLPISVISVVLLLVTSILLFTLSIFSGKDITKIFSGKNMIYLITMYFLPIVLIFLSIYRQYIFFIGMGDVIPSFKDLIEFQLNHYVLIGNHKIPALFIILNPFAALSLYSSILGITRVTNFGSARNMPLNVFNFEAEFVGKRKALMIFQDRMKLFFYDVLFISIFLANGQFTQSSLINFVIYLVLILTLIVLVALIGRGKPRITLERHFTWYIRTPMLFAIIALLFSEYTVHFSFLNIL